MMNWIGGKIRWIFNQSLSSFITLSPQIVNSVLTGLYLFCNENMVDTYSNAAELRSL